MPETPAPLVIRRRPLDTIAAVRRQASALYWDARRGRITAQEASRLANVLSIIHRMIAGGEIERRLAELEAGMEHAPAPGHAAPPPRAAGDDDDNDSEE